MGASAWAGEARAAEAPRPTSRAGRNREGEAAGADEASETGAALAAGGCGAPMKAASTSVATVDGGSRPAAGPGGGAA
eukprot:scaffold14582_cov108-Isochrysis_galbana.AAC.18